MTTMALRDLRPADKGQLLAWRNLPEVAAYMYTDHLITAGEHERWFRRIRHDPDCRYWIIVCDSLDVGLACIFDLDWHHRRCSWAFYLADPSMRGKGAGGFVEYAVLRYVFDELKLNKLCGEVLAFNEAVVKMHLGFGFQREGLFRQHIFKQGQAFDVVAVAMLREEWESLKAGIEERLRRKGVLE
jgi:UDP-4-amino-4,6-dideoxy-N-acetyl-beta-L-altrosamine N-acetyltransferase